jgi:hypothetical protein
MGEVALAPSPPLAAQWVPQLRWFGPESPGVPLFVLDDMEEHVWWERIQDDTQRAYVQLTSMRKTLSSRLE